MEKWCKTNEGTKKVDTGKKTDPDWNDGKIVQKDATNQYSPLKIQKKELQKMMLSIITDVAKEKTKNSFFLV